VFLHGKSFLRTRFWDNAPPFGGNKAIITQGNEDCNTREGRIEKKGNCGRGGGSEEGDPKSFNMDKKFFGKENYLFVLTGHCGCVIMKSEARCGKKLRTKRLRRYI
jgi:hypothetical protein